MTQNKTDAVNASNEDNAMSVGSENSTAPAMEIDFGIGRIFVQGDEDSTLDEVREEFNEQKQDMMDSIYDLKRHDYELREEFADEDTPGQSFS
jgi:hypothetical protein